MPIMSIITLIFALFLILPILSILWYWTHHTYTQEDGKRYEDIFMKLKKVGRDRLTAMLNDQPKE